MTDQLTIGKSILGLKIVLNERDMERNRSQQLNIKLFPNPSFSNLPVKKTAEGERLKKLLNEKEKKFLTRAIAQLEFEFSSRRSCAALSLPLMEKQKKLINSDSQTNIQQVCERLHGGLSGIQYVLEPVIEKEWIILTNRRDENVKFSPATPKENAGTNNEKNLENTISTEQTNKNEKREESEPIQSLGENDKSLHGTEEVLVQRLNVKMSAENCSKMISNADEKAHKWKIYFWTVWRVVTLKSRKDNNKCRRIRKIDSFFLKLQKRAEQIQRLEKQTLESGACQKAQKPSLQSNCRRKSIFESEGVRTLDKIEKELSESAIETQDRLLNSLKNFHPNLQSKLKALSVLTNVKNKQKNVGSEARRVNPTPVFLVEMESRHNERKRRWENIRKRRSEMEAEKERIMKEREVEEKKMEDIKKREKLEELKRKRRKEKEEEEEQKRERRMLKQKLQLACHHYIQYLMRKVGFQSWWGLIQHRRSQAEKADLHSRIRMCRTFLTHWGRFAALQLERKYRKIQELHEKTILKNIFHFWRLQQYENVQKIQVAVDWEEAKLSEKTFAIWIDNTRAERWSSMRKMEIANSFHERKTLEAFLKKWKKFPQWMRNMKEKERRQRLWQRKVQEFLPDYQPAFISEI